MAKINIIQQIRKRKITTNFLKFPKRIGSFVRQPVMVDENATTANFNYVGYSRGNDLGYVTLDDLNNGIRQVRKLDLVPTNMEHKVATPSDRIWSL